MADRLLFVSTLHYISANKFKLSEHAFSHQRTNYKIQIYQRRVHYDNASHDITE